MKLACIVLDVMNGWRNDFVLFILYIHNIIRGWIEIVKYKSCLSLCSTWDQSSCKHIVNLNRNSLWSTLLCSSLISRTGLCMPLLRCTLLCSTCSTLLCGTLLYSILLFSSLLCGTLLFSTLHCSTKIWSSLLCSTILCSTFLWSSLFEFPPLLIIYIYCNFWLWLRVYQESDNEHKINQYIFEYSKLVTAKKVLIFPTKKVLGQKSPFILKSPEIKSNQF